MARPDDISGLLQPTPDKTPFRQGRLLTFNTVTGANTVLVQGATLTNLSLLDQSASVDLVGDDVAGSGNGDVVIMMRMKSSWAIMGRCVSPPAAASLNRAASLVTIFDTGGPSALGTITTSFVTKQTITITPPAWATHAEALVGMNVTALNNGGFSPDQLEARAQSSVLGQSAALIGTALNTQYANLGGTATLRFSFTAGTPIDINLQVTTTNASWTSTGFSFGYMSGSIAWTRQ